MSVPVDKKATPFDYIKSIFTKEEFKGNSKDFIFIATRYLSIYENSIVEAINAAYYMGKIPPEIYSRVLCLTVSKEKPAPFINYIKKRKDAKVDDVLLGKICEHYHCNEKHGREIIEIAKAYKIKLKRKFGLK